MTNLDSILKSRDITLLTKVHLVKVMIFPVVMYSCELDHKEGWALNNWCIWVLMLEKMLESPLDCKEIKPVNPKGNQPWIFIGRTYVEAEASILCHLIRKANSLEKTLTWERLKAGEKGTTEDEMVGDITDSMDMNLSKLREIVKYRETWCSVVYGVAKSWIWLSDWTT